MSITNPDDVQLVLVASPDSGDPHLWIAATLRDDALKTVLRLAPIGSSAELLDERLSPERLAELSVRTRDVRDLGAFDAGLMPQQEIAG